MGSMMSSRFHHESEPAGPPLSRSNGRTTVGVDLARGCIHLAMARRGRIEAYHRVVLPSDMDPSSPAFRELLGDTLRQFCKHRGRVNVWATSSLGGLSIRSLQVPKVPRRQLSLAVRWALRRELSDSLKGVLVDYVVDGEISEKGTRKIAVTACAVQQDDIGQLCKIFANAGFPLAGISVPGFAFKNIVEACGVADQSQHSLFLDVGRDASHIVLCSNGRVIVSREFRLGAEAFIAACMDEVPVGESAELFFSQLSDDAGPASELTESVRNEIVAGFRPVLHRLMRQFDLTLEAGTVNIGELEIDKLHLSGPISTCPEIRAFISSHIGIPVVPLNPLTHSCLSPVRGDAPPPAIASWFAPAVGLALAGAGQTLNLLKPIQSTLEQEDRRSLDQQILVAFIIASLAAGVVWGGLMVHASQLQREVASLARQTPTDQPALSVASLRPVVNAVVERRRRQAHAIGDRAVLAMMAELTALTDNEIQLTGIDFHMESLEQKAGVALSQQARGNEGRILLKGWIHGAHTKRASHLAAYQIKIEESPLFDRLSINESVAAIHANVAVLQFRLTIIPTQCAMSSGGAP